MLNHLISKVNSPAPSSLDTNRTAPAPGAKRMPRQRLLALISALSLLPSQAMTLPAMALPTMMGIQTACRRIDEPGTVGISGGQPITGEDPLQALQTDPSTLVAKGPAPITGNEEGPADAPVSLSDPDGQALTLEKLDVRAAVQGMLSLTELELVFRNPNPRRMEGRFNCVLPNGATISRFAKEVNGVLMEGEVVERLKANQVYDAILHEMRDPALLEQDQGNRFSARIFPIEANGTVRLVLSYTRTLTQQEGVRTFELPLRGMATVQNFHFKGFFSALPGESTTDLKSAAGGLSGPKGAMTSSVQTLELNEQNYTPAQDLEVRWKPSEQAKSGQLLTAGDFYLASFQMPGLPPKSGIDKTPWSLFVDTSASTADGEPHRIRALEKLLATLPPDAPVTLSAFDQSVDSLGTQNASQWVTRLGDVLRTRHSLGGTDLAQAVKAMSEQAQKNPNVRYVLVTDGVATMGKIEPKELLDAVAGLPAQTAFHALVLGSRQDDATLQGLVAGHGRVVQIPFSDTLDEKARDAAVRLSLPPGQNVMVADSGADWIYPAKFQDVQPGAELLVVGKRKAGMTGTPAPLLTPEGSRTPLQLPAQAQALPMGTFAPLLEREGYRSYLAYLADREAHEDNPAVRQALATEQIRLSVEKRVLIPRTTLLVLESEADYQRFGLDRRALASILTIDAGGIASLDRSGSGAKKPQPITEDPVRPEPRPIPKTAQDNRPRPAEDRSKARTNSIPADRLDERKGGVEEEAEKKEASAGPVGGDSGNMARRDGNEGGASPAQALPIEADKDMAPAAEAPAESASMDDAKADSDTRTVTMSASGRASAPIREMRMESVAAPRPSVQSAPAAVSTGAAPSAPPPAPARRPIALGNGSGDEEVAQAPAGNRRPPTITAPPSVEDSIPWLRPVVIDDATLQAQKQALESNPKDRRAYNQLAESLWVRKDWKALLELGFKWQPYDVENPQVYEAIGEAALKLNQNTLAQRAFGSLVEIAPAKVELLQRAGLLLLRANAGTLSETPLRKALALRPDRVNTYRHLAFLLWQQNRLPEAAAVLEQATQQSFQGWYGNVQRVVREELGYIYRAWMDADPSMADSLRKKANAMNIDLNRRDDFRATLVWETDANDVDLHVVDPNGEECYYSHKQNVSGIELYEDITQGFGPEVARGENLPAGKYYVGVNYFSAGPMGVSRGILVVMTPNEKGLLAPQILPFRLVEGGRDMRLLTSVTLTGSKKQGMRGQAITE